MTVFLTAKALSYYGFGTGFVNVWKNAKLFRELREQHSAGSCGSYWHSDNCRSGCMAAKFFNGFPINEPDPE